jgi:phasin family protein
MPSTDQNRPTGKPGQRKRKAEQRSQKPDRQMSPKPDQQQDANEPISATVAAADTAPIGAATPADTVPVSLQTLASAYGDYTRKSLEETRSFVEKLTGVRSLDKVMEVQTEFAKQAYQTFVAESQKIRELHSELAKQTFRPLEGSAAKTTRDTH